MRNHLFKRAKWFLDNHKVKKVSESDYSVIFEVEGTEVHNVQFKYRDYEMLKLCDCKHGTIKKRCDVCERSSDCSHILACLVYLTNGN